MFGHFKISPIFWFESSERIIDTRSNFLTRIRSGLAGGTFPEYFGSLVLLWNHGGSPPFYYRVDNWFISDVQHKNLPNLTVLGMDGTECFYCLCVQVWKKELRIYNILGKTRSLLTLHDCNELQTKSLGLSYLVR